MWSRGQSWAIYGYTMVYRFTKDRKFLDFAEKVTDIYLKRLKETSDDWVPLWDMDANPTAVDCNVGNDGAYKGIPKDASATAFSKCLPIKDTIILRYLNLWVITITFSI